MYLYHTGNVEIPAPDIHYGRVNADFGQGFYLTPDKEFAYRWAWKDSAVNEYELEMTGLNVHILAEKIHAAEKNQKEQEEYQKLFAEMLCSIRPM